MRRSLLCLVPLFVLLVASRLHGYSISCWHRLLDGAPSSEVLLGQERRTRGDEWFVQIPLALAQREHEPRFPLTNSLIGIGQDMTLPLPVPIRHPITALRPATWGFFASADLGLSWMWWTNAFGILAAWTGVGWFVARRERGIAWMTGALVLLAPAVQLLAMNSAPILTFAALATIGALLLRESRTRRGLVAGGALVAWSLPAFALTFYPPFQLSIAWILAPVVLLPWLLRREREGAASREQWIALAAALLAGAIVAAAIAWSIAGSIEAMLGTAYPGARTVRGGGSALWKLFSSHLAVSARAATERGSLAVVGSLLFFPLIAAAELLRVGRGRGRVDPLLCGLLLALSGLTLHACVGLPDWLTRATGLGWVPESRVRLALAVGDALVLARIASSRQPVAAATPREAAAIALAWLLLLCWCARAAHAEEPSLRVATSVALIGANAVGAWLVLRRRAPRLTLGALVLATAALSIWWNPLVYRGGEYLRENPLSREIRAIDAREGGTTWVAFGPPAMGNLFRAIGVHALNGVHPIPQLALWHALDPERKGESTYNRYAHVVFEADRRETPLVELSAKDGFHVRVAPQSTALPCLGVTHVLVRTGELSAPVDLVLSPRLEWIRSIHGNHLFRIEQRPSAEACRAGGIVLPSAASRERGPTR